MLTKSCCLAIVAICALQSALAHSFLILESIVEYFDVSFIVEQTVHQLERPAPLT